MQDDWEDNVPDTQGFDVGGDGASDAVFANSPGIGFPTEPVTADASFDADAEPSDETLAEIEKEIEAEGEGFITTDPEGEIVVPTGPGIEEATASDQAGTPVEDVTPADEGAAVAKTDRRTKGDLGTEVKTVTDEFVAGTWKPTNKEGADELLTPHRIATRLKDRDGLDKAPSTGAVTNVIKAWGDIGFSINNEKPLAFTEYVGDGSELAALLADAKKAKRDAKAAKKAAEAPAPAGDADPVAV